MGQDVETSECDVLVVGGGLGGVAAALSAASLGLRVILTEETHWIGGQLTSQAVPPDEHRWIEEFGCTASYRDLRNRMRDLYRRDGMLREDLPKRFNPGAGWVSAVCARPDSWLMALQRMTEPLVKSGHLTLLLSTIVSGGSQLSTAPVSAKSVPPETIGDTVRSATLLNLETHELTRVQAKFFLDATELGDLLELTGTEFVTGSEDRAKTGEAHAGPGYRPDNQQALTWVFLMAYEPGKNFVTEKPQRYDWWKQFQPPFWPNPLLDLRDLDPTTNLPRTPPLPLFAEDWRCWFKYRQIVDPAILAPPYDAEAFPVTVVNWPQNDYFLEQIVHAGPTQRWERLHEAKELSRCLLYYLQVDCPRPDGSRGYPGLRMGNVPGMEDGFALTPYIRESRRAVSCEAITERMVSAKGVEGALPPPIANSVGVGSYRIDLHPSTGGDAYIDLPTLPFQLPLGALVPVRTKNLIPACKNIGTTHVTNGCYRLHPVEWNVGEVAGDLAGFCIERNLWPRQIFESEERTREFQDFIRSRGVETEWDSERLRG